MFWPLGNIIYSLISLKHIINIWAEFSFRYFFIKMLGINCHFIISSDKQINHILNLAYWTRCIRCWLFLFGTCCTLFWFFRFSCFFILFFKCFSMFSFVRTVDIFKLFICSICCSNFTKYSFFYFLFKLFKCFKCFEIFILFKCFNY